ncbi:YadA-like family protein [Sinorhizobium medicae]|uniref:YadA-like family protein n=1 Tax=Sinorhizobium medicae TaxID=110321 RepID=UPI001F20EF68|nr:YadA-like family protein [Sinorhizobium medicae]
MVTGSAPAVSAATLTSIFATEANRTGENGATANSACDSELRFCSTAIGTGADASGVASTALASEAVASGTKAIAIGGRSSASGENSIALGTSAQAAGSQATAVGLQSNAGGGNSIALGFGAQTRAGDATDPDGATSAVAIGSGAQANGEQSLSFGSLAEATGEGSVAIGPLSKVSAKNGVGIGYANTVSGDNSGAIGDPTTITGTGSYSLGNDNTIDADNAGTFGNDNKLANTADGSRIVGNGNDIDVGDAFVLGNTADVTVEGGVALGTSSVSDTGAVDGYVPFGASEADRNAIAETKSTSGAVAVGNDAPGAEIYRQITGLAAGTADSDAVNVSQLKALEGGVKNAVSYDTDAAGQKLNTITLKGGDPNQPVLVANVAKGVKDTDAANVGQVKEGIAETKHYTDEKTNWAIDQSASYTDTVTDTKVRAANHYTDQKFSQLSGELGEVRGEARQAAAIGLAASSLRFDDRPGKLSVALGGGFWRSEAALAFGAGYTSENGRMRANLTGTAAGGHVGVGAGLSITLN